MTLQRLPIGPSAHCAHPPPHAGGDRQFPLHSADAGRALEAAAQALLPPHTLMQRAGLALARWLRALYPHARHIWVAAGPGNNGGDGLLAAALWQQWAQAEGLADYRITVTWAGSESRLAPDAAYALAMARQAGVHFQPYAPDQFDVAADALLGLGGRAEPTSPLAPWLELLHTTPQPVLCVDLPSGLMPDSGSWLGQTHLPTGVPAGPRHTLSLLTLKPGLFTGLGRDVSGDIWWDDLGVASHPEHPPTAWLRVDTTQTSTGSTTSGAPRARLHTAHKGSHGDVLVLGGQGLDLSGTAMTGAALLAARAALHAGAGRVYLGLLDGGAMALDPGQPELMFRSVAHWMEDPALAFGAAGSVTVCGCGGGQAVEAVLPQVLAHAKTLVLDADALNAVARERPLQGALAARGTSQHTVLTPHPLEAARLLGCSTAEVQADRLAAAQRLAQRYGAVVVLKGSGSVVAAPGVAPCINGTGNALLATAGSGDVLAGLLGARLAAPALASGEMTQLAERVAQAVAEHGALADKWPAGRSLTAGRLAAALRP